MPWKENRVQDQRVILIEQLLEGASISDLSEEFGVSRKTIYKWLERYEQDGVDGLRDQSRRPLHSPNQVTAEVEAAIVAARLRWKWGPGKLRVKLCESDPKRVWPAVSTIAAVLRNKGLAINRRKRPRTPVQHPPYVSPDEPNRVWCGDYKGWFRTGNGTRVDPLTITDACSRYLLRCQIVERSNHDCARAVFEAAFREYGMPAVIHTDNGVPFASVAPGGLSRLSMWFVRLGIFPERSRPGSPQDNGRHERMHRTLKQATTKPPRATPRLQQEAFHQFQREYNEERPHEALGNLTPQACYTPSPRKYPRQVPALEYGDDIEVRRATGHGDVRWKGERTFISEVFGHEELGLKPVSEEWLEVYYGPIQLGWLDVRHKTLRRRMPKVLRLLEQPDEAPEEAGE